MNQARVKTALLITLLLASVLSPTTEARSRAKTFKSASKLTQAQASSQRRVQAEQFIRTELFFGSGKPDGSHISEADWLQFVNAEITPRFPDGLTLLTGFGQFRNAAGVIVRERALVLSLIYPVQTRQSSHEKIEQIRTAYKTTFQQESVLRVDSVLPVRVSF